MKLLHIIGSMNPHTGGPCQVIRNFAPGFLAQGHSLEVVCLNNSQSDYLGGDSFPVHAVGQGRGGWNFHPALLPWLEKHLPEFDAVILNGIWQYQGYALWKVAKRAGMPPYFIFPHGMLDPWFQKISVRPAKSLRNWMMWKAVMSRVVRDAAGLLFTCEEERRLAQATFSPYAPKREFVVGLGVPEPPACRPAMREAFEWKCPEVAGKDYLLFLSRIHPKKGVEMLLQAYAALPENKDRPQPKLVIAGPGLETPYGKRMLRLAVETCPPESVVWPGMLSGDVKWGALYHSAAFVLPSHQENFGIAAVEALACGRPVLISDQVNIWREIKGEGAALVEKDSVAGTTRLLRDWVGLTGNARQSLAARTKPCFQKHFSDASALEKLVSALASGNHRVAHVAPEPSERLEFVKPTP